MERCLEKAGGEIQIIIGFLLTGCLVPKAPLLHRFALGQWPASQRWRNSVCIVGEALSQEQLLLESPEGCRDGWSMCRAVASSFHVSYWKYVQAAGGVRDTRHYSSGCVFCGRRRTWPWPAGNMVLFIWSDPLKGCALSFHEERPQATCQTLEGSRAHG